MKKLLLFCIAACGFLCGGGEIEFLPGDAFRVEHALFKVIRYTAGWKASVYPGEEEGDRLQLIRSGESFEYRFHSDPAAPTASLSLQMTIPAYRFFGKPVIINDETEFLYPEKTADSPLLAGYDKVKTLDVPLSAGILKFSFPSPISVHLLDFRMFQLEDYALRLLFSPTEGEIARANLKFRMRYVPYPSTPRRTAGKPASHSAAAGANISRAKRSFPGPGNGFARFFCCTLSHGRATARSDRSRSNS